MIIAVTISIYGCEETESVSCSDGIKNGDETSIDCGGICSACSTCSDGIQNGTETGIDCGGSCNPCSTGGSGHCISLFTGSGTAIGTSPNNCGDRPISVTNNGVDSVTLELPVSGFGTLYLYGIITSGCSFTIPPDTVSNSAMDAYYSGNGSLSGNTLNFTYRADFSFGSGFDCDYVAQLQ
ncbi:MAG: hypothetical protein ACI9FU_001061 [Granulosicoccus sp.]|jgi:hypothetical protein